MNVDVKDLCNADGLMAICETERAAIYHGSMRDCTFHADMIAVDPPWRQGNLTYWSRQASCEQRWPDFVAAMSRHFAASVVYLKVGRPESGEWFAALQKAGMRRIAWWETTYYGGRNAQIIGARTLSLDGLPMLASSPSATAAIAQWALEAGIRTVADPCAGKGVMLGKFLQVGMSVVGVELVRSRAEKAASHLLRLSSRGNRP